MLQVSSRIAFWTVLLSLAIMSIVPPSGRPVVAPQLIEHAAAFLILGVLLVTAYNVRPRSGLLVTTFVACSIELSQILAPGRHPRMTDLIIDAAAMMAGVLLATFVERRSKSLRAPD
jgi:VanZ family protein